MTISSTNNIDNFEEDVFVFPASYAQKRMWFLDQFEPGSPYYNIPVVFKIIGKFDQKLFKKTFEFIIERHESLRTTFTSIEGTPHQIIHPEFAFNLEVENVDGLDEGDIKEKAVNEIRKPFNLITGPLFRVKIFSIEEDENIIAITMHHIISDGWSMGILVNEITKVYSSFIRGNKIDLDDLEIQYADFSEWQNKYLTGEVLAEQLNYWKNQLKDSNQFLDLPTDKSRQAVYTNNGSSVDLRIPKDIIEELQKLSNKEGATLFMTLLASFNVLLLRYTGQDDINVGTPIANRTDQDVEKIIGLFINTLVLRTKLDGDPTFIELLRRVKKTNLEAFEHQDLPFEMVVDAIQPERNMSYAPLFQVMLILQNTPISSTDVSDIKFEMVNIDMGTSTSDITYTLSVDREGALCSIEYNTDLFLESTIVDMFKNYQTLLEEIVLNPNLNISKYKVISNETQQKIVFDWGLREMKFPKSNSIHSLVERWAIETPDAIAVVDNKTHITYKKLIEESNKLAGYLVSLNLGKNIPIGISQDKSVNLLISLIAILKAGHYYLPLDPNYPEERLQFMINDSSLKLLITDSMNYKRFSLFDGQIINIEELLSELKPNDAWSFPEIYPNDLAYIIYTSGSTGKAKGTMIQHDSLVNIYHGWELDYGLLTDVRNHLQMASFSFDVFGGDWIRALCSGGKLVLVDKETMLEAEKLYAIIVKEDIDIGEFVPAILRNLIQFLEANKLTLDKFKVLIAGSDIWYVKEYNEFKKYISKSTRLINSFGLTETAIDSTYFESSELNLPDEKLVPIGIPFPNINIYILDKNLNILPPNVKGELYIGGVSLARGFYNKPELTAEKFIPNPYSVYEGERLYHTGDLARFLSDGQIEFLGRSDNQIKLRGFRIELGEIANALKEFEGIKDTVISIYGSNEADKKIIAYIVCFDKMPSKNKLKKFVAERVPDYMVPSAFIPLKELPLSPNGKIDSKALPAPSPEDLDVSDEVEFILPRNNIEEVIATLFKETLEVPNISVNHNFFLLGGHSLLATQIVSRIKTEFDIDFPLRTIFEKPTVLELSQEVEKIKTSSTSLKKPEIYPRKSDEKIPLSFAQERLWFLDQMEKNSPFYNIPEFYKISGNINIHLLEKAFNKIIERHEILRTRFVSIDGEPYQKIEHEFDYSFEQEDLSTLSDKEIKIKTEQILNTEAKTPFNIEELPLFRIRVIKHSENNFIIALNIHHIISDDWSSKILVGELINNYNSLLNNNYSSLPPLEIQYADYAIWQKTWLKNDNLVACLDYWKNKLNNLPSLLELPYDNPRPSVQTFNGDFISFNFDEIISDKLSELSSQNGVTTFMMLLSLFKLFLYKISGQNDICIGTPSANRDNEKIENLIGFFVNTLAIRTPIFGEQTFLDLLAAIKNNTLEAYANQEIPFEMVVDTINPERNLSHSPIFQVMFVYQNAVERGAVVKGKSEFKIEPIESHSRTSKFDLTLFVVESDEGIGGAFEFSTELFNKSTIKLWIKQFEFLVESIIKNSLQKVHNISLISNSEQSALIKELNATNELRPIYSNVIDWFESIFIEKINSIAITFNNKSYTFGELNKASIKIAAFLQRKGVFNDSIVGIGLPRSYEQIITILGILRAGGTYLPIDISYPKDRIEYILRNSNAKLIITTAELEHLFKSAVSLINIDDILLNTDEYVYNKPVIHKENLSYVIYTSGSTGKPKGTLITHEGLINYILWTHHAYPFNQDIGSIVHSTISFDATVTSIFPSLLLGEKIIIIPETNDLNALTNTLKNYGKASILKITPVHLELLSDQLRENDADKIADAMIIGGEQLNRSQIEYWQNHAPNTLLFNEYGPTETVVGCIVYEGSKFSGRGAVPIGKVIPNLNIYILDKELNQLPKGVFGELYIGGVSLARGYLDNPELTAQKFIPNPFAQEAGARLYRTGDIVKILSDGNLIFIGRTDEQVKVRGYRIELGEINYHLSQLSFIDDVYTDIKDLGNNDKRIISYVVSEVEIDSVEIIDSIRDKLPEYMLPSSIIKMKEIPLTINGKVDRSKLPMPNTIAPSQKLKIIEPTNEVEQLLFDLWSEVLKTNNFGITNNFFELGGHSLLVTKLVSRIEKTFSISYPIKFVFKSPTIQLQAKDIEKFKLQNSDYRISPLEKLNLTKARLSFTQRRLWFLYKLNPSDSIYNMPMGIKINGELNIDKFKNTITHIAKRHDILRTNFIEEDGIPYQVIHNEPKINIEYSDLSLLSDEEKDKQTETIAIQEAVHNFDLTNDALLKVRLVKHSNEIYLVFFTMHHIISDGWSINILLEEFIKIYSSLQKNATPLLDELPIQYSDYAEWQNKYLVGDVLDKQINYWVKKLKNSPSQISLPYDKPKPLMKTFNGNHISFTIDASLTEKIKRFINENEITPFMFLFGVYNILLSRITNSDEINIGTPIANRQQLETENLIGFFANTLVFNTHIDSSNSIKDFFTRIKNEILEGFQHQDAPFEKLVEILEPERDLSTTPIFQVLFVLQNVTPQISESSGLGVKAIESKSNTTQYELALSIETGENQFYATFEYNTDLFNKNTINNFINYYLTLLEAIVANQNKKLFEIEILSSNEKEQIIKISTGKDQELEYKTICNKFKTVVQQYSNKSALIINENKMSYDLLDVKSTRVAQYLLSRGFQKEDKIAVMLSKDFPLIIWLVGILKAGCVYVPIDKEYPEDRIDYIINTSESKVIVSSSNKVALRNDIDFIDEYEYENANDNRVVSLPIISEDNLSYIIFTSGSTGRPKGVMNTHKGLINLVENQIREFNVNHHCRVLQFASIGFDASISEIFMALLSGATLVLTKKTNILSEIKDSLIKNKITTVTFPPSLLNALGEDELKNVETIISAGEKLSADIAMKWSKNRNLINAYGPTEATVGVCSYKIEPNKKYDFDLPIGLPIYNVQLFVLDKDLNTVKQNTIGELFIGGISLARGYIGKPDLTACKFIPNPLSKSPGKRLYRTGDYVKINSDGLFQFVGRIDHQVKFRGYRIELSEIEFVIKEFDNINEAAVILYKENNIEALYAYIELTNDNYNINEIKAFLKQKLPDYMIPGKFIVLDKIPVTQNGKIDRNGLSKVKHETIYEKELIEPTNDLEKEILNIWSEILNNNRISIDDNFFELGGHSLIATQLQSRIENNFNIKINLKSLFENVTVKEQAKLVSYSEKQNKMKEIVKVDKPEHIPVSFTQQRLWILNQIDPGNPAFNIPNTFKITSGINIDLVINSIFELAKRHESLRTNFYEVNNIPYQKVNIIKDKDSLVSVYDLSNNNDVENDVKHIIVSNTNSSFDLENDLLFRIALIKLPKDEIILSFVFHHIIVDGWSINILLSEFAKIYSALSLGNSPTLEQIKLQYTDFSIWQRKYLTDNILNKQLSYWKNKLKNSTPLLELPYDKPRPTQKTFNGSRINKTIDSNLKIKLENVASKYNVTPFMILLTVYKIILYKLSNINDIVIGTPIANRNNIDTEKIVGFFANTLVIRSEVNKDKTFEQILKDVKNTTLEAQENQDIPFERIVDAVQPERNTSYTPLFQVMFVLQNNPIGIEASNDVVLKPIDSEFNFTQYDLTLSAEESLNNYSFWLEYNTDLFIESKAEYILSLYIKTLEMLLVNSEIKVSDIQLVHNSETKNELLKIASGKVKTYNHKNIIDAFRSVLTNYSNKIAIRSENRSLTFSELDQLSDRVASSLLSKNIGAEEPIGVMLSKDINSIAIIFGILKSSCVYVPIDPDYPQSRIKYMVKDSGIRFLITNTDYVSELNLEILDVDEVINSSNYDNKFNREIYPDSLAYQIYTSGSTGKPKGTQLTHNGLLNLVKNQIDFFDINDQSVILQFASLSFDASISEIFTALLAGASLIVENADELKDIKKLIYLINSKQVSVITLPPSMLNIVEPKDCPTLKTVVSAGEKLSPDIAEKWYDKLRLINAYGPTESTVGVCSYHVQKIINNSIPIGHPYDNIQIFVLDDGLNLVPKGIVGEIYISGNGLARGYRNNPFNTAEVFLPNPYFGVGERMYKAGDYGRILEDGNIEFVRRVDSQIKLRGYRIELGEIETTLRELENVTEVVADIKKNHNTDILVAYVVGTDIKVNTLKNHLKRKLPQYMIPNFIIEIERLPLSPNGKIDKSRLPKPEGSKTLKCKRILPKNKIEEQLLAIWKDLLHTDKISTDDSFFEIGGHSLLAIQLVGEVDKQFETNLEFVEIFANPTIIQLAKLIENSISQRNKYKSLVVQLNKEIDKPPLFMIHPSGGSVHWYTGLAKELNDKLTLYGIQAVGINGKDTPQGSIEEMASTYIKQIKKKYPKGPYNIASWSMGVIIAYEMANQLVQKKEKVDNLIILDQGPDIPQKKSEDHAQFLLNMFMGRIVFDVDKLRNLSYEEQLKFVLKKAKKEKQFPRFVSFNQFKTYVDILKIQQDAWQNYQHKIYYDNIILIKSLENKYDYYKSEYYDWEKYVKGKIKHYITEGDHNTMLHPPLVKKTAELLEEIIKENS